MSKIERPPPPPYARACYIMLCIVYFSNDWYGPPRDSDWSISDVQLDDSTHQCLGDWVCEHRWPIISAMVVWRAVAADTALRHWWDDGNRQIAFSRAGRAFIAINDDESKSMNAQLMTGLPAGQYCDVVSGTLSQDAHHCTGRTVTGIADNNVSFTVEPLILDTLNFGV